ncbi:MAG: gliding motility-associated C-terminal domain-containing protein [Flavobacteriales bacterium]|nr:gliding motility-associated C-terminal domain-containing protein [Flavobacteriales bacterium]
MITFCVLDANSTHLIGGSMSYQYLGQNNRGKFNYKITLNLYRDCQQSEVPFDPEIKIGIYHNNSNLTKHKTQSIKLISKKLVSPPGNTDCPFKPSVCIEEGFYEGIIEVDPSTLGYHLTFVRCCRNIQNNLVTGNGGQPDQGQTYYCFIPPTSIKNSSPVFKGVPSPYMCANDTTSFLNTALDPDGDSLVYYFVHPFKGGSPTGQGAEPDPPPSLKLPISTVVYNPGFSANQPFGNTGFSSIDRFNGLTQYFTRITGNFVVAIEVAEYRNGVLLGVVRLDLQIIFINCPPNKKPTISGDKGKDFVIEAGSKLCFNVISTDPDDDQLKLTQQGDIFTGANGWKGPKATLAAKTGKGSVVSEFCWQTSCDQARDAPYQFAVNVEDDGCPGKFNAANFKITVKPFESKIKISGPTIVCQNASARYFVTGLSKNSKLDWEAVNGVVLWEQGDSSMTIAWTGKDTGYVKVRETSQYGCFGDWKTLMVLIKPSPDKPVLTGPDTVCYGSGGKLYSISNFSAGMTAFWKVNSGTILSNNNSSVSVEWPVLGNQTLKVHLVNSNGCVSDTTYFKVNVRKPVPDILGPLSVCPNSKGIEYLTNPKNGSVYSWSVLGGLISGSNKGQSVKINWGNQGNGIVSVTETDKYGCLSDPKDLTVKKTYTLDAVAPFGKTSVCEFDKDVLYFVYNANGTTYQWSVTGGTMDTTSLASAISVDWGSRGNGLVTLSKTAYDSVNMKQCISIPAKLDVVIHPTPDADKISGDFDLCQLPDSVSYSVNGFAGSTYLWTINGSSTNISGQGTNTIKVAWNQPGSYTIRVQETSSNGCIGNPIDSIVIVRPKPATSVISGPLTVCDPNYDNHTYSVTGYPNSTYTWSILNGTIKSGMGTSSVNVDWNGIEPSWLKVIELSEYGCLGDTVTSLVVKDNLNLELLVVSVGLPDDQIELNWSTLNSKDIDRTYRIERRKTGTIAWDFVADIDNRKNYIDQPLNTDDFAYDYIIRSKDLCGVEKESEIHTNTWLFGAKTEDIYTVNIEFQNYLGFKNGVKKYILYRELNESGIYEPYDSFTTPTEKYYDNGLEGYNQCYRIVAVEEDGNLQMGWSNEICFNFAPTIYVPNAFSPNNDGINDLFKVQSGAIKTYNLKIFDRWGEKIWETDNYDEHWDGTYKSSPVQLGVYVYIITFTDFKDKVFGLNGTVHVIR